MSNSLPQRHHIDSHAHSSFPGISFFFSSGLQIPLFHGTVKMKRGICAWRECLPQASRREAPFFQGTCLETRKHPRSWREERHRFCFSRQFQTTHG